MLRLLRQPRYRVLTAFMAVIALGCVALGTWQASRLREKHRANEHLRANAALPAAPAAEVLGRDEDDVRFREVTATGSYDAAGQVLVRQRVVAGDTGYLVLTPLRMSDGAVVLVVRGFLSGSRTTEVTAPPPPAGTVTVTGRAHLPETKSDAFAELNNGQVRSINPTEQAARLGARVLPGYVQLAGEQPGITPIPSPDLSNPAGGAIEPQHIAYVLQWYLFAALALAAPFVIARSEHKRRPHEIDAEPTEEDGRAAKLADRYGRRR